MHNDTEHWRDAVDRIRQQNMARAGKLERELATVRQEFSTLHQNYLELGLRASRLAAERDAALKNLNKTKAYIATLESGRTAYAADSEASPGGAHLPAADTLQTEPASAPLADRLPGVEDEPHGLRKAVETIKDYVTPPDRLLKNELLMLRRDLSELGNAYLALGEQVNTLNVERDEAIENLRKAQEFIDSRFRAGAGEQPGDVARAVDAQPLREEADALAETLARTQAEKNDLEMALAERDDRIDSLLAQERQLREEAAVLNQRLAEAEQQHRADGESAKAVEARLREEAAVLNQHLAEAEQQHRAEGESAKAVEARLREEAAFLNQRLAEAEQQHRADGESAKAVEARLREEAAVLNQRLAEAEQQHRADLEKVQSLKDELEELKSSQAHIGAADKQRIAELKSQLAQIEPQHEAAQRKIADLTAALVESSHRRDFAEQRRQQSDGPVVTREERDSPRQSVQMVADELVRRADLPVAVDSSDQQTRRPGWLKTAGSFALLVLVLVGLTKIREVGDRIAGGGGELASLEVQDAPVDKSQGKDDDRGAPVAAKEPHALGGASVETNTEPVAELARRELDMRTASWRLCREKGLEEPACDLLGLNMFEGSVVSLPGGVKYSVVRNGTGIAPQADDIVMVQYRGMLLDGTEFDSSDRRGGAVSFRIDEAIPGLQYVLRHMEEGARWEVYVPAELAYRKPASFGGQPVAFDIELIAVVGSRSGAAQTGARTDGHAVVVASQQEQADATVVEEPPGWQKAETETRTFLRENAAREGVISLPSGLQYRVLKGGYGRGRLPQATDKVTLHYRGLLPDGREFDSSYEDAEPVVFSMQQVIPGWYEALSHMEEGAKWQLVIPPELAHSSEVIKLGTRGLPPLIYELELVSIN